MRRRRIFDLYSNNFKQFCDSPISNITDRDNNKIEKIDDLYYVCPICYRAFDSKCLDQTLDNPLTLEHTPIDSLGGKALILTCKQCNNRSGENLDKLLKMGSDQTGGGEYQIKMSLEGSNLYETMMTVDIEEGKSKKVNISHPKKHPYADRQIEKLKGNWEGVKIEVTFEVPNEEKFNAVLLRTAYLLAFQHFGYSYLFSEGAKIIRAQFSNPIDKIIKPIFAKKSPSLKKFEGINLLTESKDLKALFVIFSIKTKTYSDLYRVLLPGPFEEHVNSYMNYKRKEEKFRFISIGKGEYLENVNLYFELW